MTLSVTLKWNLTLKVVFLSLLRTVRMRQQQVTDVNMFFKLKSIKIKLNSSHQLIKIELNSSHRTNKLRSVKGRIQL